MNAFWRLNIFWIYAVIILTPATSSSSVLIFDVLALKKEEVMLKAETRGVLFPKGGEIIEFFVDGDSIGNALSGGDGIAYKSFVPQKTGTHEISVRYGDESDRGLLLSLKKGSGIVFIDVEGSKLLNPFSKEPLEKKRDVIANIMKKYSLVYLKTGLLDIRSIRAWIRKNEFPESVIMPWREGEVFSETDRKKLAIKAVIGSQQVIESAKEYTPQAYSFEELEGAEKVYEWKDIEKELR